jgi:hypothetical protein
VVYGVTDGARSRALRLEDVSVTAEPLTLNTARDLGPLAVQTLGRDHELALRLITLTARRRLSSDTTWKLVTDSHGGSPLTIGRTWIATVSRTKRDEPHISVVRAKLIGSRPIATPRHEAREPAMHVLGIAVRTRSPSWSAETRTRC